MLTKIDYQDKVALDRFACHPEFEIPISNTFTNVFVIIHVQNIYQGSHHNHYVKALPT